MAATGANKLHACFFFQGAGGELLGKWSKHGVCVCLCGGESGGGVEEEEGGGHHKKALAQQLGGCDV